MLALKWEETLELPILCCKYIMEILMLLKVSPCVRVRACVRVCAHTMYESVC